MRSSSDFTRFPGGMRLVGNLPYNIIDALLFISRAYAERVRDMHSCLQARSRPALWSPRRRRRSTRPLRRAANPLRMKSCSTYERRIPAAAQGEIGRREARAARRAPTVDTTPS